MRRLLLAPALSLCAFMGIPMSAVFAADPPPEAPATTLSCVVVEHDQIVALGGTGDHGVVCRWSASDARNFDNYRLFRKLGSEPVRTMFRTADRHRTWFLDTTVVPGSTYRYRLGVFAPWNHLIAQSQTVAVQV